MRTASRWLIAASLAVFTAGCGAGGGGDNGAPGAGGSLPDLPDSGAPTQDAATASNSNMTFATSDAAAHPDAAVEAAADAGADSRPLVEAGPPSCLLTSTDCSSCRGQYCSTVVDVCTGEPSCNGAYNTYLACSCDAESHNDTTALAGCGSTFGAQSAEASGVSNCVSTACKNECGF